MMMTKEKEMEGKIEHLEREVRFLRDPPISFHCAWLKTTTQKTGALHYDSMYYDRTNQWTSEAGIDIDTGLYTAGYPGTYTISYDLWAGDDTGEKERKLFLRKNGESIRESQHLSFYDQSGRIEEQGGRTLITHLARGDTVDIFCEDCSGGVNDVLFCIELSQFDPE